jgi:hypothetical protein
MGGHAAKECKRLKTHMKVKTAIIIILAFGQINCSNKSDQALIEKENELLKKEIELLKKEYELKSKDSTSKTSASNKNENSTIDDNWKTFNHEFGYTIQLPCYFSLGGLTASSIQYYDNDLFDDIMVGVESLGTGSQTSLIKDYELYSKETDGVTYKELGDNWFVISGKKRNEIFYYKMISRNNETHFLMITYPKSKKELFDRILPRISKSFQFID